MPAFGGLSPYPRRCGGGTPRLESVRDSLVNAFGTAYSQVTTDKIGAHRMALARVLNGAWSTNERLAGLWDPNRMTGRLLTRWERILGYTADPDATEVERRAEVLIRFQRTAREPDRATVRDELIRVLGSVFTELYYLPYAYAVIRTPDGTYPFGSVATPGVPSDAPWSSSLAHICILTAPIAGMTDGQYYTEIAKVAPVMEALVPSWCTYCTYRAPAVGTAIDITNGPQDTGFYLDNTGMALSNNVFAPYPIGAGFFLDVARNFQLEVFA